MSILSRALVALLLGAPAFSCFADPAAPLSASAQSPTSIQNSALWQYQRGLIDPAYPVVEKMQNTRTDLERMVKTDQRDANAPREKLARFEQWLEMLHADIQGQRKAGITHRNEFLAGTDPSVIHTTLASFACSEAVTLGEGSFSANLSDQQTVWIALQSDAKQTVQVNTIGSNVDTKIAVYDQQCPEANQDADELRDDDLGLAARYELPPARAVRKFLAVSADQAGDVQIRVSLANGIIRGKVMILGGSSLSASLNAGRYQNGYFANYAYGYTQSDGTYSMSVEPNDYYVFARDNGSNIGLLPQLYPNVPCFGQIGESYCAISSAALLTVPDGGILDAIDFNLTKGGSVSGRITGQNVGETPSVRVYFPNAENNYPQSTVDSVGRFRIYGLPTSNIKISASANGAQTQLYNGINCPNAGCDLSLGTSIPVSIGVEKNNVDFNLTKLPTISGTIMGAASYSTAFLYNSSGYIFSRQTDSAGKYEFSVSPGTYYLSFNSPGFSPQLYANKPCSAQIYQNNCSNFAAGTPVIVEAQQNIVINAELTPLGSVSGQVLDDLGAPIAGATVRLCSATDPNGCNTYYTAAQVQTNETGNYSVSGIPAGGYYVVAASNAHLDKAYPNIDCQITPGVSCNPQFSLASLVSVQDNVNQPNISFFLDRSGSISGALNGSSYYYGNIEAAKSGYTAGIYSQFVSITNNTYKMLDLPAGEYRLIAGRQNSSVFAQIYANRNCAENLASPCQITTGDPIILGQFSTVVGKDFNFSQRRGASGFVRNINGAPIPNAIVDYWVIQQPPLLPTRTYSTLTDSQGRFVVAENSYSGNFYLSTDAPNYLSNQIYAGVQCAVGTSAYAGTCSFSGATVLTSPAVMPGQLDNIIFNLQSSGLGEVFLTDGFESRGE